MAEGNIYNMSQQELMQALTPPQPEDKGFIGNLFTRRLLNPIQEKLGIRESLADQMRREQIGASRLDAFENMQGMQRDNQLRQQLIAMGVDSETANSLPIDKVAEAVISGSGETETNVYGDLTRTNPLSGVQQVLSQAPTSVREFNFSRSQTQPPMRTQSYDDFIAQKNKGAQSTPSAVQSFNFLTKLNPEILKLPPKQQEEYFFKIIRQDPDNASRVAEAQERARNGGLYLTPAQKVVDEAFGKVISDYRVAGGQVAANARLQEFDDIILNLESADPGQITGLMMYGLPKAARPNMSVDTQDRVEKIITEGLRQTLGAQFTEAEAANFIARSYNIMLPESINADRLRRVRKAMQRTAEQTSAAGAYYDEKGTLQGYKALPTLKDVEQGLYKMSDYSGISDETLTTMLRDETVSRTEWEVLYRIAQMRRVQ